MDTNLEGYFHLYKQFATAEGRSPRTIESYIDDVTTFAKFLGSCPDVTQITAEDLRRYILHLKTQPRYATHPTIQCGDRPLSDDSVASYVRGIRSFWSWMKREGFIQENPFERVKPPKLHEKVVEPLLPGEFTSLLNVIPKDNKNKQPDQSIILTLYGIGARVSEVVPIPLNNINFESGQITVTGKGGKQRALFMSPVLFKALFRYRYKIRPSVDSDLFFLMESGRPVSRYYIGHKVHAYALQANIGRRVYPHLLRFSFAIGFLRNGGDPFTLQQILGHSSLDMTRHYVRIASTDVERSLKKYSPVEQLRGFV
jgi:site-specific recombinase XerD